MPALHAKACATFADERRLWTLVVHYPPHELAPPFPRYHPIMDLEGDRICDGCGQKIPPGAKLATKTSEGRDLCLACQIREAQITKGLRH